MTAHHRFLIAHHLRLIEELERHIAAFDTRIEELLEPLTDFIGSGREGSISDQIRFPGEGFEVGVTISTTAAGETPETRK